jgi:hypothetical protein
MDAATYRMLIEMQVWATSNVNLCPQLSYFDTPPKFREVTPQDYELLGRLDDTVKPKSLDSVRLVLKKTLTVQHADVSLLRLALLPTLRVRAAGVDGFEAVGTTGVVALQSDACCLVCLSPVELEDEVHWHRSTLFL